MIQETNSLWPSMFISLYDRAFHNSRTEQKSLPFRCTNNSIDVLSVKLQSFLALVIEVVTDMSR